MGGGRKEKEIYGERSNKQKKTPKPATAEHLTVANNLFALPQRIQRIKQAAAKKLLRVVVAISHPLFFGFLQHRPLQRPLILPRLQKLLQSPTSPGQSRRPRERLRTSWLKDRANDESRHRWDQSDLHESACLFLTETDFDRLLIQQDRANLPSCAAVAVRISGGFRAQGLGSGVKGWGLGVQGEGSLGCSGGYRASV